MAELTVVSRSQAVFERAKKVMPGGVNSPVRSLKSVGAEPIFMDRADGSYLYDVDGNRYIDYVCSWGPIILGHRHPRILEAIEGAVMRGTSFGAPCKIEVEMAEQVCQMVPSIEMVRMVSSGTEACMSAVRLARAFTKRDLIVKFDGCYHGHADQFLIKAGSGLATLGISSSPGVPEAVSKLTISLPFNDKESLKKAFEEKGKNIACVIVEPYIGNSGLILPDEDFMKEMRELCTTHGALLIYDEVMTGFRVAKGGAQERLKITPDLTCLGKVIGGGFPVGAYGGRTDVMSMIAPQGPVYQAGTLSGNPIAMYAGLAQLRMLSQNGVHARLEETTKRLADGFTEAGTKAKVPLQVVYVPGMLTFFFNDEPVVDFECAQKCDTKKFAKVWRSLNKKGVYWPPSQFESAFLTLSHSKKDIDETIEAFKEALAETDN